MVGAQGMGVQLSFTALDPVLGTHSSPPQKVNIVGSVGNGSGLGVSVILASTAEILWPTTDHLILSVLTR